MTNGASTGSGPPTSHIAGPISGSGQRRSSYASVVSGATQGHYNSSSQPYSISSTTNNPYSPHWLSDTRVQAQGAGQEADMTTGRESYGSSWRKTSSLPSYSRQFASGWMPGQKHVDSFFTPSYLRNSRYMKKLEKAHKDRQASLRDIPSAHSSNPPSLSTSSSNVNLHRTAPSHRGMTYDVIENASAEPEDSLTPLPSRWNNEDKYPGLDLLQDGLEMRYSGPIHKMEHEAAAARTDNAISPQCGIYYYEVTLLSKSKDGMIALGFASKKASLERLPGWDAESWAYHGDDGKAFGGEHTGKDYGPTFTTHNVIGCGINFATGCIFFTKDGVFLGNAFRDLKALNLYPSVGMKKHAGAQIRANFGQTPFVFNIDEMVADEQRRVEAEIDRTKTHMWPNIDETSMIQDLVAQYLAHDGYVETAKAFAMESKSQKLALTRAGDGPVLNVEVEDDVDAINRQRIRASILEGDIEKALKLTNAFYPHVLEDNPQIVFRLKCRKFVEMIRRYSDISHGPLEKAGKNSVRSNMVPDVFEQDMELDDQLDGQNEPKWDRMETDEGDNNKKSAEPLQELMEFGQILQREYRDEKREYVKALQEIFSLMAYDDARGSPSGHLLESTGRVPVAEELNSAILISLGKPSAAALERVYQQCEALIDEISEEGTSGAFVNVKNNFLL